MAEEVVITIRGDDQASDDLRRVLGALNDNEQAVNDASGASNKSAKASGSAAGGMGKMKVAAAAGAAAVAGLAVAVTGAVSVVKGMVESTARQALEADRMSSALGLSTQAYSELAFAAKAMGAEGDHVADAIGTITDRAEDAKAGMQSFKDDFALVGIEVEDLRGKNPEELFRQFAEGVASTEDPNKRATAALRVLGDDVGRRLLPLLQQGEEGLDKFAEKARELGVSIDQEAAVNARMFEQAMVEFDATMNGVSMGVGNALIPALTALFDAFRVIIGPIGGGTDGLKEFAFDAVDVTIKGLAGLIEILNTLSPVIAASIQYVKVAGQAWKVYWNVLTGLAKTITGVVVKAFANILDALDAIIGAGASAASALGMDGMAGELRTAQKGVSQFQDVVDGVSTAAFEDAKSDMADVGDAVGEIGGLIMDLPEVDSAVSKKLEELAGRVEKAQESVAEARDKVAEEEFERPAGAPDDRSQQAGAGEGSGDGDDEAKKAAEEARRNELARERIEILRTEDELQKAKLERELALNELADQDLTRDEKRLEQMRIENEYQARRKELADQRRAAEERADEERKARAADRRQGEIDDIRDVAAAFKGTGSQMASDVGNVIDVFADVKEGSASSVDAVGAVGEAAASFAGQLGASAEEQAGIMAIFETAMGFATLFTNPAESAGHFLAAANFGMIAATGGGASGGSDGGSSIGGGEFRSSTDEAAEAGGRVLAENLGREDNARGGDIINIDFSGATMLESAPKVQQRISNATDQARRRKVSRGGSRG
ncbi:MAG: hypothetical protein ACLFVJ_07370 [Persicimonas sp.]